ncbi:hypothetical protein [Lacrimispora amygdalina]|nr:hypothetical protein [Clostridium indicum]
MGNDLLSLSRLLFCGADVYMLCRFFAAIYPYKTSFKKRFIYGIMISFLIFLINAIGSAALNFTTVPLVYYIYVMLLFKVSLTNGMAYTIIYFAFVGGREVLFELLYRLIIHNLPIYIPPWFTAGGIYFLIVEYFSLIPLSAPTRPYLFLVCRLLLEKKKTNKSDEEFATHEVTGCF